jgi:ABC-2 type transport system ATP-binding protein
MLAGDAAAAGEALSALAAAGIELSDFAMGQPSLDEVFFALTGQPGAAEPREKEPA